MCGGVSPGEWCGVSNTAKDQPNAAVRSFLEAVKRTPKLWQSIDLRFAAVSISGGWHLIGGVCRLRFETARSAPAVRYLPRTPQIWAGQLRLPVDNLGGVLQQIASGRLLVDGEEILCASEPTSEATAHLQKSGYGGDPLKALQVQPFQQSATLHAPAIYPPFVVMHHLRYSGDQAQRFFSLLEGGREGVDKRLRALPQHWDGVDHLMNAGIGALISLDTSNNVVFDVLAPLGLAFDDSACTFRAGVLTIGVLAESARARSLASITYVDPEMPPQGLRPIRPRSQDWERDALGWRGEVSLNCSAKNSAVVLLRHAGEPVRRIALPQRKASINPIILGHEVFDPELSTWKQKMLGTTDQQAKPDDARAFERDVGRLFGALGFLVDVLENRTASSENVDIIATAAGFPMLAIECTLGSLKSDGKLSKLFRRAESLRTALRPSYEVPATSHGAVEQERAAPAWRKNPVLPLMICRSQYDDVPPLEREDAGRAGIAVLSREDLKSLFDLSYSCAPPSDVYEYIVGRIHRA